MKRRLTVVPVLVIVGLALLGLSGCGGSGTASASDVATQYVRDVLAGKGLAACSLMTPAERRNSNAFWALAGSTRYAQAGSVATSCSQYYAGLTSSEEFGAGLPALTRVVRSSVTGAHATVTFAPPSDDLGFSFMGMTDRDQLSLTSIGGRWGVDVQASQTRQQTIAFLDAKPACTEAWNAAVGSGAAQLPDLSGLASNEIWADLIADSGCSDIIMLIDTPDVSVTVDEQDDGSWLLVPSVNAPASGTLERNVWLDSSGTATPASDESPDGVVPALAVVEPVVHPASAWYTAGRGPAVAASAPAVSTGGTHCPDILDLGTTGHIPAAGVNVTTSPTVGCILATEVAHSLIGSSRTVLAELPGHWTCLSGAAGYVCTAIGGGIVAFTLGFPPTSSSSSTSSSSTSATTSTASATPITTPETGPLSIPAPAADAAAVASVVGFARSCQTITEDRIDTSWAQATFTSPPPSQYCLTHDADGETLLHRTAGTWHIATQFSDLSGGCPAGVPDDVLSAFALKCPGQ